MNTKQLWMLAAILTICGAGLLTSCSNDDEPVQKPTDEIEAQLSQMTLREKVGQMFFVRPESLDATISTATDNLSAIKLQEVNDRMRKLGEQYPVGGIILFAHNIKDPEQLVRFISDIRTLNGSPALCVDEEGGRVARIANNGNFGVPTFESMQAIAETDDPQKAYECGATIGEYLNRFGFDIDFAPVADVNTNPENTVIGKRAFGSDPELAAKMVVQYLQGLKDNHVVGCMKHFPGHGDTKTDTHYGYAETQKTWKEMLDCEMITFKAGIQWGCQLIMTAHIAAPKVTGSNIPATMSSVILQDKLRGELGYNGVIITDGMEMGAIMQQYTNEEAAVGTIKAGADIILVPQDFVKAFDAVVQAVQHGDISEERINQSVRRILKLKKNRHV